MSDEIRKSSSLVAGTPLPKKYYVLMIAIDYYPSAEIDAGGAVIKGGFAALNNPVFDANNVLKALREKYDLAIPDPAGVSDLRTTDPRYKDYSEPIPVYGSLSCKCLYNESATVANIRQHISDIHTDIGQNDAFLIYFAGHGSNEDDGYIIPYDAVKSAGLTNWLAYSVLYNKFKNYLQPPPKCRDLLLILDCCFSGAIVLGKQGNRDNSLCSREVLMSCGADKKADDGDRGKGSPFANALVGLLQQNNNSRLVISDIKKKFDLAISLKTDQNTEYGPLPVDQNGNGEFVFPLKTEIAADVPVQLLANSFIKNLNFDQQKASLNTEFLDCDHDDFNIISTCAYNFDVQQLMRTVILRHIKEELGVDLHINQPIIVWPDSIVKNDFWAAVAATLDVSTKDATASDTQKKVITNIMGRLLRDREKPINSPIIISLGYQNNNPEILGSLLGFCESFHQQFTEKKQDIAYKDKMFDKLYIVISDVRSGTNEMLKRDELVLKIKNVRISVTPPIDTNHIKKGNFTLWKNALTKAAESDLTPGISIQKIKALDPFADGQVDFEILKLIQLLGQNLQVEPMKITQQLGIIPQ